MEEAGGHRYYELGGADGEGVWLCGEVDGCGLLIGVFEVVEVDC